MVDDAPGGGTPPRSGDRETARLIERALALGLVALLLWGVLRVLYPFVMAIAFGGFIAIGSWPLRQALVARGLSPVRAAMAMLVVVLLLVAAPIILIAPGLPDQIREAVEAVRVVLANAPVEPPSWLAALPLIGGHASGIWTTVIDAQGDINALIAPYSVQMTSLLVGIGTAAAESVLQILLAVIVTSMFWINGDTLAEDLRDIFGRIGGPTGTAAVDAAGGAVRGVAWGIVGTAALQGALMGVGLAIAGIPGAPMLGFLTFVFSVSQILAPLILVVWGGAAYWHYAAGETGWAVFVVAVGIAVSFADNVVRPLLIRFGSPMPLTLIILGVFGGLIAFGFLGLFLGPALLAVAHGLLKAWRGEVDGRPPHG